MISHRLIDDYVITDLFSFSYDLLQSFCSICKSFLLASFMKEWSISFKRRRRKKKVILLENTFLSHNYFTILTCYSQLILDIYIFNKDKGLLGLALCYVNIVG